MLSMAPNKAEYRHPFLAKDGFPVIDLKANASAPQLQKKSAFGGMEKGQRVCTGEFNPFAAGPAMAPATALVKPSGLRPPGFTNYNHSARPHLSQMR